MNDTAQAVTPHAHDLTPIVDLAGQHGSGPYPHAPAQLCRAAAALQPRLPGRREHPGLARASPRPVSIGAPGKRWWPTTRCRRPTAASAITPARPPVTAANSMPRCRFTRSSASSATWRPREGWTIPRRAATGKRVLVVGAGPSGLSAAYHLARLGHPVEIHEAGPVPGGMLHFGIPAYRLPRADLLARDRPHRADGRRGSCSTTRSRMSWPRRDAGRFDAVFIAIGAHVGKHVDIPARDAVRVLDAVTLLREIGTGEHAAARPPGGGLRRRQYRDGRRPHRPPAGRRGGADRLSPRPRAHAGARLRGRRGARRGRQDQVADHASRRSPGRR